MRALGSFQDRSLSSGSSADVFTSATSCRSPPAPRRWRLTMTGSLSPIDAVTPNQSEIPDEQRFVDRRESLDKLVKSIV